MRRLRDGERIAGIGGLALLAVMFVDWYGATVMFGALDRLDLGATAWEAFSVLDVVLALLALVPLILVVLQATRDSPSLPIAFSVFTTVAGAIATLLILYRIVNQPGANDAVEVEAGAWLGLAAAAAIAVGGWRSMRVEAMPGVARPPVEELSAP
jgi:carbon starvation protein CstA